MPLQSLKLLPLLPVGLRFKGTQYMLERSPHHSPLRPLLK
jgi:hypothetical protein